MGQVFGSSRAPAAPAAPAAGGGPPATTRAPLVVAPREAEEFFAEGDVVVVLRARTTCKQTREIKKKRAALKLPRGGLVVGTDPGADFRVDDANLSARHVRVFMEEGTGAPLMETLGRTYFRIGHHGGPTPLFPMEVGQVIKMGACSLQVTDIRLESASPWSVPPPLPSATSSDEGPTCYICFESTSEPGNELLPSPCTCRKTVHRECLRRWISTKGSRLCSICRARLPIEVTADAPFLVLQVVRHMRGLHWTGEREYIISFGTRRAKTITVGSGADCDLSLPDPSLSRTHSRICFERERFEVQDMGSSAGTFLKVTGPHPLYDEPSTFKMGRTFLTLKVFRISAEDVARGASNHTIGRRPGAGDGDDDDDDDGALDFDDDGGAGAGGGGAAAGGGGGGGAGGTAGAGGAGNAASGGGARSPATGARGGGGGSGGGTSAALGESLLASTRVSGVGGAGGGGGRGTGRGGGSSSSGGARGTENGSPSASAAAVPTAAAAEPLEEDPSNTFPETPSGSRSAATAAAARQQGRQPPRRGAGGGDGIVGGGEEEEDEEEGDSDPRGPRPSIVSPHSFRAGVGVGVGVGVGGWMFVNGAPAADSAFERVAEGGPSNATMTGTGPNDPILVSAITLPTDGALVVDTPHAGTNIRSLGLPMETARRTLPGTPRTMTSPTAPTPVRTTPMTTQATTPATAMTTAMVPTRATLPTSATTSATRTPAADGGAVAPTGVVTIATSLSVLNDASPVPSARRPSRPTPELESGASAQCGSRPLARASAALAPMAASASALAVGVGPDADARVDAAHAGVDAGEEVAILSGVGPSFHARLGVDAATLLPEDAALPGCVGGDEEEEEEEEKKKARVCTARTPRGSLARRKGLLTRGGVADSTREEDEDRDVFEESAAMDSSPNTPARTTAAGRKYLVTVDAPRASRAVDELVAMTAVAATASAPATPTTTPTVPAAVVVAASQPLWSPAPHRQLLERLGRSGKNLVAAVEAAPSSSDASRDSTTQGRTSPTDAFTGLSVPRSTTPSQGVGSTTSTSSRAVSPAGSLGTGGIISLALATAPSGSCVLGAGVLERCADRGETRVGAGRMGASSSVCAHREGGAEEEEDEVGATTEAEANGVELGPEFEDEDDDRIVQGREVRRTRTGTTAVVAGTTTRVTVPPAAHETVLSGFLIR